MRVGIVFGSERFSTREIVEYAKAAEESGFESVWVAEHLFSRDAFVLLTAAACETEKVELSTGIVNIYSRSPVQTAMNVATLNELSNGRVVLGIGTGNTALLCKIGVKMKNHLSTMRDFATVVRDLLAGRIVTYKGSLFSVEKVKLNFDLSRRKVPIYLAAVRPKMLQLAGELGDGVLLSSMVSREYVLNAIDYVRMGAERIGKNLRDVDVACFISAFVSEDSEVAQAKAKAFVLRSLSSPGIFSDFHMWEIMFGREFRSALDFVRKSLRDSDLKSASKYVTDEMVSLVTIAGRPDECRRRLNEFVRAGVTVPVINPIPGSDPLVAIATFSQI